MTNTVLAVAFLVHASEMFAHPAATLPLMLDENKKTQGQQILSQLETLGRNITTIPKGNTR